MAKLTWRNDWLTFLETVKELYDRGFTDDAVSDFFGEKEVRWVGRVQEQRADEEMPGVQLAMTPGLIELSDGRFSAVDYLFLNLDPADRKAWRRINTGESVRFTATLVNESGPFTGISWSDLGDGKGLLLIGTENGKLVEVVGEK